MAIKEVKSKNHTRKLVQKSVNHINKAIDRAMEIEDLQRVRQDVVLSALAQARRHLLFYADEVGLQIDETRRA